MFWLPEAVLEGAHDLVRSEADPFLENHKIYHDDIFASRYEKLPNRVIPPVGVTVIAAMEPRQSHLQLPNWQLFQNNLGWMALKQFIFFWEKDRIYEEAASSIDNLVHKVHILADICSVIPISAANSFERFLRMASMTSMFTSIMCHLDCISLFFR